MSALTCTSLFLRRVRPICPRFLQRRRARSSGPPRSLLFLAHVFFAQHREFDRAFRDGVHDDVYATNVHRGRLRHRAAGCAACVRGQRLLPRLHANCNRVAKGSFKYCETSCGDYCAQDDRQDGLSGSVGSKGGEVGWLSAYNPSRYFGDAQAVPYGEDKPPAFEMPTGVRSALRTAVQGGGSSSSSSTEQPSD